MSEKRDPRQAEYLMRALSQVLASGIKPGVHHVIVEHEDTCPMLKGGHQCTCTPDVTLCDGEA